MEGIPNAAPDFLFLCFGAHQVHRELQALGKAVPAVEKKKAEQK